jgi:hypothetical protein
VGIGGAAAVLALLTAPWAPGPAARRMGALGARLRGESRAPTADEARQMARLRARVRWGAAASMLLLVTATACMAVWRYV